LHLSQANAASRLPWVAKRFGAARANHQAAM
jgi:hypothetical protein